MVERPSAQLRTLLRELMRVYRLNRHEIACAAKVRDHSVKTILAGYEPNVDLADTVCRGLGAAIRLGGRGETLWRREQGGWWRVEPLMYWPQRASVRLAKQLGAHIDTHKLQIRSAARMADIPEPRIRNLLRGHVPGIDTADSVCRALGMVTSIGRRNARISLAQRKPVAGPAHRAGAAARTCSSARYGCT